ncbi:RelA/SpoT family protein [Thermocrinis minervae]|uniref:GTP pyrophosphokinase/guanosine-3',5'-bis(Diphosphate) 3'-pyrophosphohydrolase n=1 Tax=Thermocrinis minervae TaxID=381751 RepID=A0A1M6R089_9AQUI|nr:bifunctional (p)ppGpp synthetase/guanosine-3',5'-bis(diphosphate) 3'-pyrophosphohydrolase [Thermocrinis minervae]SHK25905.1 GTP pyrophosphokinase/guanosine-3',5'-bis(diphosphate) 3'-pyrophosphohydrolase [Thermocrinis minervae]
MESSTVNKQLEEILERWEKVRRAYEFVEEKHRGQKRASGEPYINHLIETALIVYNIIKDEDSVAAALLHDVLEDTQTTYQEIKELFGVAVADIVQGVTKLSKLSFKDVEKQKAENYRKLILAMAKDIRVIIVKLADRLHNMRTLHYLRKDKQIRIAKETLEIYVPIANRLGIWQVKNELEDLCFMHLYPKEYHTVKEFVAQTQEELKLYLQRYFIPVLKEALEKAGLKPYITYRPKHLYGIWQKTIRKGIRLEDVHDILGVRVLLNEVSECYLALGVVHSIFKPVPGRFDDYISLPKANMYQSLHTTVIGPKGRMVEVQIRTWEMHERAEKGIAAHWAYKEGKSVNDNNIYSWLKNLVESIKGSKNPQELLENVKLELFSEEVFVFTPKGDLVVLPKGATPVDFAFHIHTDIGMHCAGAKVNGRIVPLDYRLQNGDMVEIITHPNKTPKVEWLNFVVTSKAKSKIKAYIRELEKERTLQEGKKKLELYAKAIGLSKEDLIKRISQELQVDEERLYLLVGEDKLTKEKLLSLLGYKKEKVRDKDHKPEAHLSLADVGAIMHQRATCCMPVPGEEVYGVVVKGKGIVIHSSQCPNLQYMLKNLPEKVLKVDYKGSSGRYPTRIRLSVKDRIGILGDVTSTIAKLGVNILEAKTKSLQVGQAIMEFTVEVENYKTLKNLLDALRSVEGVEYVGRLFG